MFFHNFIKAFQYNFSISFIKPDKVFLLVKDVLESLIIVSDLEQSKQQSKQLSQDCFWGFFCQKTDQRLN